MDSAEKPLIIVTTSHRPTQRVRSFVKDLVSVLPRAVRLTRGKATLRDLYYEAMGLGVRRVVVVSTWKGNPGTIRVYEPLEPPGEGLREILSLRLAGVKLSRERPEAQRSYGARVLGVVAPPPGPLAGLADSLVRGFLARLVFSEEEPGVDVAARISPGGSEYVAVIDFVCTGSGRPCGPLLRLAGGVDHVSGLRLHRARGVAAAPG
ncbi:MAG: Brix domain containing protein [Crenarchaeota archaeon]|nr:Brix domain containing protein [Thermoproteota archaeon]